MMPLTTHDQRWVCGLLNGYASAAGPWFRHRNRNDLFVWKLGDANFRWLGCLAGRRIIMSMNIIININITIFICFRGDDSSGGWS